jgi:hypothetical protein
MPIVSLKLVKLPQVKNPLNYTHPERVKIAFLLFTDSKIQNVPENYTIWLSATTILKSISPIRPVM